MNFFEHQDRARGSTKLLVFLFVCAVVALIAITAFVIVFTLDLANEGRTPVVRGFNQAFFATDIFLIVSAVVISVVALGTLYRIRQLGGGGKAVAESLGGRLLNVQTRSDDERKILNVVEEMAIAAGLPVPQVYLIDDAAINAFAAGYDPQDAVIGVTRGCIQQLSRDELQGVIAHEFSHILNGDMRLNIRLIGWLYGIMVIGLIGYHLLRSSRYSGGGRKKGGGIIFLGLGLMIVGYAGTFFGNMIKAAVSRQREFLADASAVQYTRNPGGIGGALKRIGGYAGGTAITTADATEISHMLFGPSAHFSLFATHPPLTERIRRIEPRWDGKFTERNVVTVADSEPSALPQDARTLIASIGQLTELGLQEAQARLKSLPPELLSEVHNSLGGCLTLFALIIAASEHPAEKVQWPYLREQLQPGEFFQLRHLFDLVLPMERKLYLPLVDLALPALHQLSADQCQTFMQRLQYLIQADAKVSFFEWCLFRILRAALAPRTVKGGGTLTDLGQCAEECRVLLSAVAREGNTTEPAAVAAFAAGVAALKGHANVGTLLPSVGDVTLLDDTVNRLRDLQPMQKPLLLAALVQCVRHDGEASSAEVELLRAVGAILNCPVPPLA